MPVVKSRREQYSDATRAALLDSARTLFAERGFAGTALEDVATDALVTRGAVYHHFSNKRALFEAVFDQLESNAVVRARAAADEASDPWHAAMNAVDAFLDHCCDPVYGRIVWQEGPIALGWERWEECEDHYAYGLIEEFLRQGVDQGVIDPAPIETTTRLACSVLGTAGATLAGATEAEKPRVRSECGEVIRRLFGGLRTRPE